MGDTIRIGPECFAMADESVICWRGRNYVPQQETANMRERFGYGIFGVLAAVLSVACVFDLGWRALIVLGFGTAFVLVDRLICE